MGSEASRPQDIHDLRAAGCSYRVVASRMHCSFRAISPSYAPDALPKKVGRPKKITEEISNYIETVSSLDATLTNCQIRTMILGRWPALTLSEQAVSGERVRLGFLWRPPRVKQELSAAQEHQRLQFAIDLEKLQLDPARIVFSDESRFVLGEDNRWRHVRKGQWNETAFVNHTKFPVSVMIWGAIGVDYKSGCVFCSNGVDSEEYQRVLRESEIVHDMDNRAGPFQWYFMQDGASAHTSKSTREALSDLCLILPGWPPNSPDLNPIEMIWAIMKRRVKKEAPKTKEDLQKVIRTVWDELDQGLLSHMVRDFTRRLRLVIEARGRSISPYLSSHRTEPTAEDAAANEDFRPFDEHEDDAILESVNRWGHSWKKISGVLAEPFGAREPTEIKNRAKWLLDTQANLMARTRHLAVPAQQETPFAPEAFFQGAPFQLADAE